MGECLSCGEFVSQRYERVFGDNDNDVHQCQHCGNQLASEGEKRERANLDPVKNGGVV